MNFNIFSNGLRKGKQVRDNESWRKRATLITPIGRKIESISYQKLGISIAILLVGFAAIYWLISLKWKITTQTDLCFWDALYFSVVTFSTLGYGDISPINVGKFIASIEVLSGLLSVALFVGKVASERQSALLLLLYTGEQQRRIRDFVNAISDLKDQLSNKLLQHDHEGLYKVGKQSVKVVASVSSYLSFQSTQGRLADYGNISALRALYRSVVDIQQKALTILKIEETEYKSRNTFKQLNERSVGIGIGMPTFHKDDGKTVGILNEIQKQDAAYKKWDKEVQQGNIPMEHNSNMTEALLEKVRLALPNHPWPKSINKSVATQLGITNRLAQKCIVELIRRRTWSDLRE